MEHRMVALLAVSIALAGAVSASVLHGPGVSLQHLPYEVTYPNAHSPVILSQPLGLTVDALLTAAGYVPLPAPVAEVDVEGNSATRSTEGKESAELLSGEQLSVSAPEASIGIEDAVAQLSASGSPQLVTLSLGEVPSSAPESSSAESPLPAPAIANEVAPSSPVPESPSLAVGTDLPVPESLLPTSIAADKPAPPAAAPESPSLAADTPLPVSPLPAATPADALPPTPDVSLLDSITRGSLFIDADGKLQMQATYTAGGQELTVVASDLAQPDNSVPVIVPEVPVVAVSKPSKRVSNVNVNVNVNVNGDGTGSSFNATSVSKINAPVQAKHKSH